jgi:hypothetical protein
MPTHQPTDNYEISLPDDVVDDYDGRVSSYWIPGNSVLLQLSSTLRIEGGQVAAADRLRDLYLRSPADWISVDLLPMNFSGESAAARMKDEKGTTWIHIYLTTDTITVYATVSGPGRELGIDNWALEAIRGIRLRLQIVN